MTDGFTRTTKLFLSAVRDGATTFIVFVEEADTTRSQTVYVEADSEEDAIDRVMATIKRDMN